MCISLKSVHSGVGCEPSANKRFGSGRKKVWALEHRFHCSIAGTCFTLDEMRRFCRKAQVDTKGGVSDYELHTSFVAILGDAQAARPAAKYLDRKYKAAIKEFEQASSSGHLKLLWNDAVAEGEIAAAFWTVVTHPQASEELLFHVYGEVHMLSHLSGASIRLDMQALTQLRQRVPALEQELAQSRVALLSRTRHKGELIETLNRRLDQALRSEVRLQQSEEQLQLLESGDTLRQLRAQLAECSDQLKHANRRADRAEAELTKQQVLFDAGQAKISQHETQLLALDAERSALENTLENLLSAKNVACENNDVCQKKLDLAGRCILYVGGRNRLCAHFRTLVEQQNGRFIHHDGGREESPQRLDALLSQVDAVLCPVDCVSHDAVGRIRRDCKRYGKYLMLLPQSSLSAFTKGVLEFSQVSAVTH